MLLGVTMGDACGVGPEILVRAFTQGRMEWPFVAYGDVAAIQLACEMTGCPLEITLIGSPAEAAPGAFNVIDAGLLRRDDITIGRISEACGSAALSCLNSAIADAQSGAIDAIVTLPMNKEATRLRHPGFSGHTEELARACGTDRYVLMLAGTKLAAAHVSTHVSMARAVELVTTERILDVIELTHGALSCFMEAPRIVVAGLNPHAGEHGAFGREELDAIAPAVERARAAGITVDGPEPPDTVFMKALQGRWDAVICMYHDQGHIAMKLLGFGETVNVTVGLPIIRCSVDHGTAFDIAYQGVADFTNFLAACRYAARMAAGR